MQHEKTRGAAILVVRNVTKTFGATTALKGIDLEVREGEFLTLLGPSGCGKTTLIRILAGFETPTSGDVLIDGKSILSSPPYRRPLGMVFQNLALFPHLTVADNIGYGLRIRRESPRAISTKVHAALEMVGLEGFADRYIGQLSGGQRQRVALARAIVMQPRVLLLDEPLGALDMKIRRQMQTELKQIQEKLGTTFIFVTHDQEEALTMSDRVAVFRNGAIEQIADPSTIYEQPDTRFVAEFVGDTNFLEGVVQVTAAGQRLVHCTEPDCTFALADSSLPAGTSVGVSLRPQYLKLAPSGQQRLRARVTRRVYAGQITRLWLQVNGRELIADWYAPSEASLPATGQEVGLTWDDSRARVLAL